jgi:epoxide hydrolase-like predicted phosphatase
MTNYKAIIFDLGEVIFDVSFRRAHASWAQLAGYDVRVVATRFNFDDQYDLFSMNRISSADYAKHVGEMIGYPQLSEEEFERGWNDIYLDVYPGMHELVVKLKENYRLVSLTNTNATHAKRWPEKYADTLAHFEKVFSSHLIGMIKPEANAYQHVIDYLQLPPSQLLFLDDKKENVAGANAVGIKGILVENTQQLFADLEKEGIH